MKKSLIHWPTLMFSIYFLSLGSIQLITGNAYSVLGPFCKDSFPAIAYLHLAIGLGLIIYSRDLFFHFLIDTIIVPFILSIDCFCIGSC